MFTEKCRGSVRWAFNFWEWKPTKEEWTFATRCVQQEENERIHRFVFAKDCKSSMIAQLLMRKAVSENLGIPYDEVRFSRSETGKPYISSHIDLLKKIDYSFNVSHHGNLCVLAAEQALRLGVDVMKVEHRGFRSVPEYFNMMQKQFSSSEWDFITGPGLEIEQLRRFFRLWCLKESYVKAKGTGISYNLKSLSFECMTAKLKENITVTDTQLFVDGLLQSGWTFEETMLDKDHCVAVAVEKDMQDSELSEESKCPNETSLFSILNFDELMKNARAFVSSDDSFWQMFSVKKEKPH